MLRSKHLFLTISTVLFCILSVSAQPRNSKRFAAIENEKIAYITKELNLTTAEAQRFFPIYNQYTKDMWAIRSQKNENRASAPRGVNSFNKSPEKRDVLSYDAKELDVKKEYRQKFAKVIGSARASEFFEVEQNFRELLYKELQQRRNR